MKKQTLIILICILCFALSACGNQNTVSTQFTTPDTSQAKSKSTSSENANLSEVSAEEIILELKNQGLQITQIIVYDETTDKNEILGQPGKYIGKADFQDERMGNIVIDENEGLNSGTVEVFNNQDDCQSRYEYLYKFQQSSIESMLKNQYIYKSDFAILRVSTELGPSAAQEYENAFYDVIYNTIGSTSSEFGVILDPLAHNSESNEPEESGESIFNLNFDVSDYMEIKAEILFEYGAYLTGDKIITVATVSQIYDSDFRSDTENGGKYSYDLEFDFNSSTLNDQVNENDVFTVAGIVKESSVILGITSVVIEDCVIVGYGEIAESINSKEQEQIAYCAAKKQEYEIAVSEALKAERDEYVSTCETVSYEDVARNPDNYKGKQIRFSGKVIQVSEGMLDSVTLRINENGGNNTWYVTYTRQEGESRILENDWITCYGECSGVTSYVTVMGATVTIPSLKMRYYE